MLQVQLSRLLAQRCSLDKQSVSSPWSLCSIISLTMSLSAVASHPRIDPSHEPVQNQLCLLCSDMVANSELLDVAAQNRPLEHLASEEWPFYPNEDQFLASVRQNCHLCSLIWLHRFPLPVNLAEPAVQIRGSTTICIGTNKYGDLNITLSADSLDDKRPLQPITIPRDRDLRTWHNLQGPWRSQSTASESTLRLACSWLQSCQTQHKLCSSQGIFPQGYPRRLLRLSSTNTRPRVNLHEVPDPASDLRYLTLSHCWGTSLPLKLTRDMYDAFIKDIPIEDLPFPFKNAIDITQRLGYEYLWIDALCIVQDDPLDWENEAPRMGTIYGNSVCTIAALSSKGSNGGCYASRMPLAHLPCRITTKSGSLSSLHSAMSEVIKRHMQPINVGVAVSPPLHRRAWVVQERALSARTIYFSQVGIYWECCCAALFETDGEDMPESPNDMDLKYGMGQILRQSIPANAAGKEITSDIISQISTSTLGATFQVLGANWHSQWWQMIERYTRCGITRQSDRWPAVSGMGEVLKFVADSQIIAGLWQSRTLKELLWSCTDTDALQPVRFDKKTPTWSWLSISSPVRLNGTIFRLPEVNFVAKLLHFDRENPLCIHLEAPLLACPITKIPNGSAFSRIANENLSEGLVREIQEGRWWPDTQPDEADLKHAWLLQITRENIVRGLVIRQMATDSSCWYRLGSFAITIYEDVDGSEIGNMSAISLV